MTRRLFLLDGHYLIYRSHHAMAQANLRDSRGQPTGAIYGLLRTLLMLIEDYDPDYLVCALDSEEPTFRHEFYEDYKLERPEMPDDLKAQIPKIKQMFDLMQIPVLLEPGFESDDLLASVVEKWHRQDGSDLEVVLVTNDKDNFQLVGDGVSVLKQKQGLSDVEMLDAAGVEEELGVPPEQVPDYLALVGDSVDNIPGVEGIGPTYASRLLDAFGSVEAMFEETDEISGVVSERLAEAVLEHRDQIRDSKHLVELRRDAPVSLTMDEARFEGLQTERLIPFCRELGFRSIRERLSLKLDHQPGWDEIEARWRKLSLADLAGGEDPLLEAETLYGYVFWPDADRTSMNVSSVVIVLCNGEETELVSLDVEDVDPDSFQAALKQLEARSARFYDQKVLQVLALRAGLDEARPRLDFDLRLASYLVDPDKSHGLNDVISRTVGTTVPDLDGDASPEERNAWLARRGMLLIRAAEAVETMLEERDQREILEQLELPLTPLLAQMEYRGIALDDEVLRELSAELESRLEALRDEAHELAGTSFNLNSPKQLREILFERLELPVQGKTDSGKPSTDADSLEALKEYHELPAVILEYRRFNKLESTYLEPLVEAVNPRTGRVHTEFNQTVAATGRLSSSRPNLQNIPVREQFGRRVRGAFVPSRESYCLLAADYSQIELRLLAHMSQDEALVRSFREGVDVHTATAAELFDRDENDVEESDRRVAKVVNYGIAYGLSAYGLARDLDLSEEEAQEYIDRYFERYPGVRAFLDQTVDRAQQQGFVETLWGRRRYIPDLTSDDYVRQQFARRAAVNAPIQGSAADLMKQAMIDLDPRLEDFEAGLLLQVHDELVLEVDREQADGLGDVVQKIMGDAMSLRVPITVDVKSGDNWDEVSK